MYKPRPLDTAKVNIDSSKVKSDSSKAKPDTTKAQKKPAIPPPIDSSKIVLPRPGGLPLGFPTTPNPNKRIKRFPLKNVKDDSMLRRRLEQ
jgi:hypothetical protein